MGKTDQVPFHHGSINQFFQKIPVSKSWIPKERDVVAIQVQDRVV